MSDKIKLAVIGSRTFQDKERLYSILDKNIDRIEMIISGGANGADNLAQEWAKDRGVSILIHYPKWHTLDGVFDRGAGMRRNRKIISDADKVLAFWDGESKGTKNSLEIAKQLGKFVKLLHFTPPPPEPEKEKEVGKIE